MENPSKKLKSREELIEFSDSTLGLKWESTGDKVKSTALLRFFIQEIHNKYHAEISEEDIEAGLVDNAGDLGIDFIHKDDGQVLLVQTKFRGKGRQENLEEILKFQSVFNRLTHPPLKRNQKLEEILGGVDFENDSFRLVFVTTGSIQGQAQTQTDMDVHYPSELASLGNRTEWEYLDESGLDDSLRDARSITASANNVEGMLVATGKTGQRSGVLEIAGGEHRACVLVVDVMQLVNLCRTHRERLFNLNIRNYIGGTRTNKDMIETALESPSDFFFFNNGISCVASALDIEPDRVRAKGLQVINGAQTVRALVKAQSKAVQNGEWHKDSPQVLVRITEISTGYAHDGRFLEDVTRYNNSQNVIKASDFRSNDGVQLDLARKFQVIRRLGGRQVRYLPKRTDKRFPNTDMVRLEEFAKVIYSFLRDPIAFSGSTSFLFDESPKGGYVCVFGDGVHIWESMPTDEFKLRAAIWWLAQAFAERINKDRTIERDGDKDRLAALERKWMVIFVARLILEQNFGNNYKALLSKHYEGDWKMGEKPIGVWFEKLYDFSKRSVQFVYKTAAQEPGFVHRNWMRKQATVDKLINYATLAPGLMLGDMP